MSMLWVSAATSAPQDNTRWFISTSSSGTQYNKGSSRGSFRQMKKKEQLVLPPRQRSGVLDSNWKALSQKLKKEEHSRYVRKRKHPSVVDDRAKQKRSVPDVWFDDVDADILDVAEQGKPYLPQETGSINETICMVPKPLVTGNCKDVTRVIAMDCEMVGAGDRGCISLLARVSIVNSHGHVLYDTFVKPKERVTDYRTFVSGVRASDLKQAPPFSEVQNQVAKLIDGKILVGHALNNDLQALLLNHPHRMIRDTQHYPPFKKIANGKRPSLRLLSKQVLHIDVQKGEHSSVEDARAAMALYQTHKKEWESGCITVNPHKKTAQDS